MTTDLVQFSLFAVLAVAGIAIGREVLELIRTVRRIEREMVADRRRTWDHICALRLRVEALERTRREK